MTERIWHSGPPPHVGWWNARLIPYESDCNWRWWDGVCWSDCVIEFDSIDVVMSFGSTYDVGPEYIQWTDYWPENARVPRIKP